MKPEQINRAIAEHLGWTDILDGKILIGTKPGGTVWDDGRQNIPSYTTDLDTMHEAEKTLTDEQFGNYCFSLQHLYLELSQHRSALGAISATSAQRAEAFLRTVGKWKE